MSDVELLPRFELREEAFRRYEPYIIRACHAPSFVIDPKPMKAHSFVCRFRDAIRGLILYGYPSDIPAGAKLNTIKCFETKDGRVLVKNEALSVAHAVEVPQPTLPQVTYDTSNREALASKIRALLPVADPVDIIVTFHSMEDHSWFPSISPDVVVYDDSRIGPCKVRISPPNPMDE